MSWSVWMEMDAGGSEPVGVTEHAGMTYNVSPMYHKAGLSIRDMEGKTGADMKPLLVQTLKHMQENEAEYLPLNPANGWGDYNSAMEFIKELLAMAEQAPNATYTVC